LGESWHIDRLRVMQAVAEPSKPSVFFFPSGGLKVVIRRSRQCGRLRTELDNALLTHKDVQLLGEVHGEV
jgi:hypothetical protein